MNISHIWFDFAGTLYRETPSFNRVHDEFRYSTYATLKNIKDPAVAKEEFLEQYKRYGSNSAVFRALGQSSNYWMNALDNMDFKSALEPDIEVGNTLEKLSREMSISLFSNFPKTRIVELLNYLKIDSALFSYLLSGDDVTERKPALDGFRAIIALSKLPPEQIMYVGDRVDVDIKPAKSLGLQTTLIYGHDSAADYSFQKFGDLLQLL